METQTKKNKSIKENKGKVKRTALDRTLVSSKDFHKTKKKIKNLKSNKNGGKGFRCGAKFKRGEEKKQVAAIKRKGKR